MTEITYTTINHSLCQAVADLVDICFPDMLEIDKYTVPDLEEIAEIFQEGTIIAMHGEKVVGMGTGIFTNIDFDNMPPTENDLLEINGQSAFDPDGDYYYGSDFCVHPDYRGRRIGRGIYDRRKAVVVKHNKVGFAAAAVLPGYAEYKHTISVEAYLVKVIAGELFDPTLSMQMRNGFKVIRPIKDFFTYPKSDNWAALILWENESHH